MRRAFLSLAMLLIITSTSKSQDPQKPGPPPARPNPPPARVPSPEAIAENILQRMDTNKDGRISKSEATNRVAEFFSSLDVNKDGFVDRKELTAIARSLAGSMPPGPLRPGLNPGRTDPLDFDALDRDADGRLTASELRGTRFADQFSNIDRNKDGKIDAKEWAAYHVRKP